MLNERNLRYYENLLIFFFEFLTKWMMIQRSFDCCWSFPKNWPKKYILDANLNHKAPTNYLADQGDL